MFKPAYIRCCRTTLVILQNWANEIARMHCDDHDYEEFMYEFSQKCRIQHAELEREFSF